MRSRIAFVSLAFILGLACISFGQMQRGGVPSPPPQAAVEIVEQAGSPLRFGVDEQGAARYQPMAALRVSNVGTRSVRAYVFNVQDGPGHYSIVFLFAPLAAGDSRMEIIPSYSNAKRDGTRPVSIDYVEFADGTSWGADALGRSKNVSDFFRGRNIAIIRLKELIGTEDPADFMRPVEVFRGSSFGGQITAEDPRERDADFAARGYEQITSLLRNSTKRPDESKELARKLESMEKVALQ